MLCLSVTPLCESKMGETAPLKRLKLEVEIEESTHFQEMICSQHDRPFEIYCHTDKCWICYLCKLDKHKFHVTVAAVTERTDRQTELREDQMKFQKRIQENQIKVQELKKAVINIKHSAQAMVEDSERIFSEMIGSFEKKRLEVTQLIRDHEKTELNRAEELIKQLEQEIAHFNGRDSELEQLSQTPDHILFLERFQSYQHEESPTTTVNQDFSFVGLKKSLFHLKTRFQDLCKEEFQKIPSHVSDAVQIISPQEPKSRRDFLKYFHHLTLDPSTAHPNLILSEKNRVVTGNPIDQPYSDHQERFSDWFQVFCKEQMCGRCYWEVDWSGTAFISVSYKGISRKGQGNECVFGFNDQSWSLERYPYSLCFWHNNVGTRLQVKASSRIGVYVDHGAGTLSFYSVSDTMRLLHRVQTTFTQPLHAGFRVYFKSSVRLCDP